MKVSVILSVVASAALAAAQLSAIPQCALTCAISSIGASGCSETDIKCICSASAFLTSITSCVQGSCTAAELAQTLKAAQGLCSSAGVTLSLPGTAPTSTAAPVSSSSSAAAPPPVSTTTTTSAAAPPATYGSSSASAVYVSQTVTVHTVHMTTTITTCTEAASTPTYTVPVAPAGNGTATYAPAPPAYTGAASQIAGSMVLAVGGAFAALFL